MGQTRGVAHAVRWGAIGEIRAPLPRVSRELLDQAIKRTEGEIRRLVSIGESQEAWKEKNRLDAMKLCRRPYR